MAFSADLTPTATRWMLHHRYRASLATAHRGAQGATVVPARPRAELRVAAVERERRGIRRAVARRAGRELCKAFAG